MISSHKEEREHNTPRCKKGHEEIRVGLVSNEELRIQCQVDAVPEVTRFFWTYNTTRGVLRVQGGRVKNKGGISTLQFRPPDDEIRSLSCWAANDLGRQETPCLFYVVPADTLELMAGQEIEILKQLIPMLHKRYQLSNSLPENHQARILLLHQKP
ncbi:hypothetical protein WA026_011674 [Henosepilachna vigintioctopunctata]|uniref:Ig-like domain-containing protein n=1 Tax=Henosepilachna vigintioctopunctata TaxID=420089 RepID=A0AAW1UJZ4_9CUCU